MHELLYNAVESRRHWFEEVWEGKKLQVGVEGGDMKG